MADPQHLPELDPHDRLTVRLYRSGLVVAAVGCLATGVSLFAGLDAAWVDAIRLSLLFGTVLAVANLHLYDKRIRWVIVMSASLGAACWAASALHPLVGTLGLGLVLVAVSALALKEQFCFRVPGMRLVPLFLATATVGHALQLELVQAVLLTLSGLLLTILAVAKLRMPLHFDIGNKSNYQI